MTDPTFIYYIADVCTNLKFFAFLFGMIGLFTTAMCAISFIDEEMQSARPFFIPSLILLIVCCLLLIFIPEKSTVLKMYGLPPTLTMGM